MWFIYPETANIRLEDMNSIFGDATTAAPTPATLAEAESLFSGNRSPISSFRLGEEADGDAVPPLDVDGRDSKSGRREGTGGWISNMSHMLKRGKSDDGSGSGRYKRVGQEEDR